MKKKKKLFTILIVLFILMAIFYGAYSYVKNKGYQELSKYANYNHKVSIFYQDETKTITLKGKYKNLSNEIILEDNSTIKLNLNKELVDSLKGYAVLPNSTITTKVDINSIKEKDELLNTIISSNEELTCKFFIKNYSLEDVTCKNKENTNKLDIQFKKK